MCSTIRERAFFYLLPVEIVIVSSFFHDRLSQAVSEFEKDVDQNELEEEVEVEVEEVLDEGGVEEEDEAVLADLKAKLAEIEEETKKCAARKILLSSS